MKKFRTLLSLMIVAAVICVGLFTACGAKDNGGAEVSSDGEQESSLDRHFIIATDKGFSPFEYEDKDGEIVGIDVDLLKAISEDQGFTYDLHYIGWDAAIAECQSGQADGLMAGVSITDEREKSGWIFSDGYYDSSQGMAVAKDSDIKTMEDLKDQTVVVKTGTESDNYASELSKQYGFKITRLSTSPDLYQEVIDKKAAACFDDTAILRYNIKVGGLGLTFVEGSENDSDSYGFAVFDKDHQELLDLFNAGLKNIKANGTYDKIIDKYL